MKKTQIILSYVVSFAVLIAAVAFSLRYLWGVFESTKPNYRTETIYLTQGDSLQNYYSATIPELPVRGMLVLNSISLTPDGYRLASEKGLIVVSAKPFGSAHRLKRSDSLLTFRNIVSAAARRYHIREERIMIGDFSKGDTAYVSCKKARNMYMAEPFRPDETKLPDAGSKTLADESGLISWAASVFKEEK